MHDKIALVFPGQGSQSVGMMTKFEQNDIAVKTIKNVFETASSVLDYDLYQLVQHGPKEQLAQTTYTQPALLAAGYAAWLIWQEENPGIKPAYFAGHSLGEYTALVCAEAIDFCSAIKLVAARGTLMQTQKGVMAAILGLEAEKVIEICKEAAELSSGIVQAANFNTPLQTVIAGETAATNKAIELAKKHGARKAIFLAVSVPAHSELMCPIVEQFRAEIKKISWEQPKIPVLHNVNVATSDGSAKIAELLVQQLYSPVRWVETIKLINYFGITNVIECGPGKVLSGMNKRILELSSI